MPGGSELNFSLINHADFLTQIGRSDQFHHGIGVERYTPVFQTGVERALLSCPSISRDANTGAGQDFTDLAGAVQPRLRVAFGSQTLIVKLRLLPGWNTVRIRGDPPISTLPQLKHQSAALRTRRLQVGFLPGVPVSRRVSPTRRGAPLRTGRLWVQILHAAPICPRSPTQRQRT